MKNKPKIAIIAPYWRPARITGTELANEIVYRVCKIRYNTVVITSDSYAVRYFRNIVHNLRIHSVQNIIRLKHNPFIALIKYLFRAIHGPIIQNTDIYRALCNNDIRTVYLSSFPHDINQKVVNVIKQNRLPIKIIFQPHYHPLQYQHFSRQLSYLCKSADQILVWTKEEKKKIIERYLVEKEKITIIKPPIFTKVVQYSNKQKDDRKVIKILYAGEKNEHKGIYSLIEAFKRLDVHNIELITIGPHNWKWELYKRTHSLPFLKDLGYVDHKIKEKLFSKCDIFCLPSHADSFGFAYLDAWKYKKPVIAADTPVMREIIGKGGLLVDRKNPDGFSCILKKLVDNRKLREEIGQRGFTSLQRFSYRKNLKSFLKLFEH